jgi:Flp pilus assembly protein TadB
MTNQRGIYVGALVGLLVVAIVVAALGTPVYTFLPIAVAGGILVVLLVRLTDAGGPD